MKDKHKIFIPAFLVFLLVVGGIMLFRGDGDTLPRPVQGMAPEKAKKVALPSNEDDRFRKTVSFSADTGARPDGAWVPGKVGDTRAFLDNETKLVWSAILDAPVLKRFIQEDLATARAACAALEPAGRWELPMREEIDTAGAHGLKNADINSTHVWMSYYYLGKNAVPAARQWKRPPDPAPTYRVRCVARTD